MHPGEVFVRADESWVPTELARGPFGGIQGGAAAALMSAEIESAGQGFLSSVTTHFLRPVPVAPLRVAATPLRQGRRVSVFDATLSGPDGVVAVQRATAIRPQDEAALPIPSAEPAVPEEFPAKKLREAPAVQPWLMDVMEMRVNPKGVVWFRATSPIVTGGPMTCVLPFADWAHGIPPPLGASEHTRFAIPNADVTVHLFRAPMGPWIGLEPVIALSRQSIGAGWASLRDIHGLIGRVAMSVAVSPRG
jgi:Thioesterase-like superfamily